MTTSKLSYVFPHCIALKSGIFTQMSFASVLQYSLCFEKKQWLNKSWKPRLPKRFEMHCWVLFFGIEGHVALDRNTGPWYDILLLRLTPGYVWSASPHRQFHSVPAAVGLHCQTPTPTPSRLAVCTIFIMVFGMIWREPTTYRVRGGHVHANH